MANKKVMSSTYQTSNELQISSKQFLGGFMIKKEEVIDVKKFQ